MIFLLLGCSSDKESSSQSSCQKQVPISLQNCISDYSSQIQECYLSEGQRCSPDDPKKQQSLDTLEEEITASCQDNDFGNLSVSAL